MKRKAKKKAKKSEWNIEGYIFGALRKIWRWHPVRRAALKASSCGIERHVCAKCKEVFPKKQVQVDHINPVIDPKTGFTTWDSYITRLLRVTILDVQVLCKVCHRQKTNAENTERRKHG
jgi:5-methylcytosine-specific restriction endonuclease McrA